MPGRLSKLKVLGGPEFNFDVPLLCVALLLYNVVDFSNYLPLVCMTDTTD